MINFIMITNQPDLARLAETSGVGRIFVDLEHLGKKERQGHLDTHISNHTMDDVFRVKQVLEGAQLLVRLNPLHAQTHLEAEQAIDNGADILMLPMFRTGNEVEEFTRLVDGRVKVAPLVETFGAVQSIEDIVKIQGVSEIYIGLNDLHLDMNMQFIFEPLANGLVDKLAATIKSAGLPFGFGGIARVGEGIIPGELILGEHLRLGSSSVILSRTFHRNNAGGSELDLRNEVDKLLSAAEALKGRSPAQEMEDHRYLQKKVSEFVAARKC